MRYFQLLTLAFTVGLYAAPSFADHAGDPIGDLMDNSYALNQTVQNSWLHPRVKMAMQRYMVASAPLDDCSGVELVTEHSGPNCMSLVPSVQAAWSRVSRYLYDTQHDFPAIHEQYHHTDEVFKDAMQFIRRGR